MSKQIIAGGVAIGGGAPVTIQSMCNTPVSYTHLDSASTLHAWEAIVELTGRSGIRRLPIKNFYIRAGQVDIRAEEGLSLIHI